MFIALFLMWFLWLALSIIYIIWKREDWYLFLFPPLVITIISILLWCFSEILAIVFVTGIHIYIFGYAISRYFKR